MPATGQELPIDEGATALEMAQTIMGPGVTVNSATYTGWSQSSGIYTNGDSVSGALTPSDTGVILSTGRASDITRSNGDPNRQSNETTNTSGPNNEAGFNAAAGTSTYDASYLDINFDSDTQYISMQFTFASEEYPEYTGSVYNDIVGVWVNGQLVESPVVNVTQINSVNQSENATLFNDNTGDDYNTEMDGFTVTLTLLMEVSTTESNNIRIGIADVGDSSYDSSVLIAADSLQGAFIAYDDEFIRQEGISGAIDVLENDPTSGALRSLPISTASKSRPATRSR